MAEKPLHQCPYCHSFAVSASRRRGLWEQAILRLCLLRPFRCRDCYRRHYGSSVRIVLALSLPFTTAPGR